VTEEGMQIDERDTHFPNAEIPTDESFEPASKVTVERDRHPAKASWERFTTDAEMQIDESDAQFVNAAFSIYTSRDPDSKVTVKRDRHPRKHS
jgi:hypothetical protein